MTERLIVRQWHERDRPLFHLINSDERVTEFFPFRRDRAASDGMMDRLAAEISDNGFGFAALELAESGETIGFCGLHRTRGIPGIADGSVEIGWRLAPAHWGRGYVTEAARRWLTLGFGKLALSRIFSFAVKSNGRSTAVMRRLGMRPRPEMDFDHPGVPDSHPHLRRHVFYEISAAEFASR